MNATPLLLSLVTYSPSTQFRYSTLDLSFPPSLTFRENLTGTGWCFHPPPLNLAYTLVSTPPSPASVSYPWYMQGSTPGGWYGVSVTVPGGDTGCGLTGWGCTDWWLSQYAPSNPSDPGSTVVWEWVSYVQAGVYTSPTLLLGAPTVLLPAATPGGTGGVVVGAFTPFTPSNTNDSSSTAGTVWPYSPTTLPWLTAVAAFPPIALAPTIPATLGRVSSLWEAGSPSLLGLLVNKVCFIEGGGGVPTSPFIIDTRTKYGVLPPSTLTIPPRVSLLTPYFSTCQGLYVVGTLVPTLPLQVVQVAVTLTGGSYGALDVCKWQALPLHATQGLLAPQTLAGPPSHGVGLTWPVAQFPAPTFPVYAPSQPGLVSGVVFGAGSTGIDMDVLDGGGVVVIMVLMVAKEGVVGGGGSPPPLRLAFSSTLQTLFNGTPGDQLTQLDTGTRFLAALNGVPLPPFSCPGGSGGGSTTFTDPVASCFAIDSTTESFAVGTPASLTVTLTAAPGTGFINQAILGSPFLLPVNRVASLWSGCSGATAVWSTTTTTSASNPIPPSASITLWRGAEVTLRVDVTFPAATFGSGSVGGCGTLTTLPMQYFWLELLPVHPATASFLTLFNVFPRGVVFSSAPLPPTTPTSTPLLALFVTFTPQHTGNLTLCLHAMGTTLGCFTPNTLQGGVSPLNSTLHSTLGWLPSDPLSGWDTPTEARLSVTAGRVGRVTIDWRDASGSLVVGEDWGEDATTSVSLAIFNATPILGEVYDTNPWGLQGQQKQRPAPCTVLPSSTIPSTTSPTVFTYNCTASGWYTMGFTASTLASNSSISSAFVYDPRPLQVLPGRPAFFMGTMSGPTVMAIGTCSDWHVRLRDRFGNGLVDDLPTQFVSRYRPVVWAEWVAWGVEVAVRGGMKATLEGPNATVPSPWGGYSGGGTVRVRACAFSPAPPGNYSLRVVLTLQAPGGMEGELLTPNPGPVTFVSGPPWGARCAVAEVRVVNSTDPSGVALSSQSVGGSLITVRAGEGGVATLSVWLKDRLGYNLSSGAAGALSWGRGSSFLPLITAFAVHMQTLQRVGGVVSLHPSDFYTAVFSFPLATLATFQGTVAFNITIAQSLVTIPSSLGTTVFQPTLMVLVRTPSPTPSPLPSPSLGVEASTRTPTPETVSAASTPTTSSTRGGATASWCPSMSGGGGVEGSGTSSPSISAVGGVGTLSASVSPSPPALVSFYPTMSASPSFTSSPSISAFPVPTSSSFLTPSTSPSTSVPPLNAPTLNFTLTPLTSSTASALYTATSSSPSLSTPTTNQTSTPVLFYVPPPTSSLPPESLSPTPFLPVTPACTPSYTSMSSATTTTTIAAITASTSMINATQVEEQPCSSGNFMAILFCKYPVESRGVAAGLPLLLLLLILLLVCCCRRRKQIEGNPSPPPTPRFSPLQQGTHPLFSPLHAAMLLASSSSSSSSTSSASSASASQPSLASLSASGSAPFRATASEASESAREGVHGATLRDTVELFRSSFIPVGAPKIGGGGGPGSGRRTEMLARLLDFTKRFADK